MKLTIVICAAVFAAVTNVANGCSCAGQPVPQSIYCNSDFVIQGTVLSQIKTVPGNINAGERIFTVKLQIVFKGPPGWKKGKIVKIYTAPNSAMCGIGLTNGKSYILSGNINGGKPSTMQCDFHRLTSSVPTSVKLGFKKLYRPNCRCKICRSDNCRSDANSCYLPYPWASQCQSANCYINNAVCKIACTGSNSITIRPIIKLPVLQKGCRHNGKTYQPGSPSFPRGDGCNRCSCQIIKGQLRVICTLVYCHHCVAPNGYIYSVGQSWNEGPCKKCTCSGSNSIFAPKPKIVCKVSCCYYNGRTYMLGSTFPHVDGCNKCTCKKNGTVVCTKKACPPVVCAWYLPKGWWKCMAGLLTKDCKKDCIF